MKFKMWKSVKNDYAMAAAFSGIILGIMFMLFYTVVSVNNRFIEVDKMIELGFVPQTYVSFTLAIFLMLVIIVSLICFIRRCRYIKSFADVTDTVKAKVIRFKHIKNGFKAEVEFPFKGETYRKKVKVMLTAATRELMEGSEVELLIKDGDPNQTLVAGLFFE